MRFRAALATAIVLLVVPSGARAGGRDVFLGDSLVDNHNSFILSTPVFGTTIPVTPPNYKGRFSNGPNWTDRLDSNQVFYGNYYLSDPSCDLTGFSDPSACGSVADPGFLPNTSMNFAVGGSRSGTEALGVTGGPGMLTALGDLKSYITAGRVAPTSNATFFILTGGNDYSNYLNGGSTATTAQQQVDITLGHIASGINTIATLGAKRVVVLNLFDLGKVPGFASSFGAASSSELSTLHDTELPGVLATERQKTGLDIVLVDLRALYADIFARPGFYGFTNTTGSCLKSDSKTATGECPTTATENEHVFWDTSHPTTAVNALIEELVSSTLYTVDEGPSMLQPMDETQLVANRTLLSATSQHLDQWHFGPAPTPAPSVAVADADPHDAVALAVAAQDAAAASVRRQAFVSGSRQTGHQPSRDGLSGYDYSADAFTVGVDIPLSPETMVGFHLGYVTAGSDVTGGGHSASRTYAVGVHGGWRRAALSVTGQFDGAWIDVYDVERPTEFPSMPLARGTTDGWLAGGAVEARYAIPVGDGVKAAPLVRIEGSEAWFAGYSETGAGFMDLNVDGSSAAQVRGGLGGVAWTRLTRSWGAIRPEATVVFEHDLLHSVDAAAATLASGQQVLGAADRHRQSAVTLSGKVGFALDSGVSIDASVSATYGDDGSQWNVLPLIQLSVNV